MKTPTDTTLRAVRTALAHPVVRCLASCLLTAAAQRLAAPPQEGARCKR